MVDIIKGLLKVPADVALHKHFSAHACGKLKFITPAKLGFARFSKGARLNGRGQFFSPDLIIALTVFIIILAFFFVSSHAMSVQIDLYYIKNELEDVSHAVVNPLVLFGGEPYNWETKSFSDLNRMGLANERNILDDEKVDKFVEYLTTDYNTLRTKMSLGKYDFKFELQDFNGSVIKEGGYVNPDFIVRIVQKRIASYNDRQVIVRGIISYAN